MLYLLPLAEILFLIGLFSFFSLFIDEAINIFLICIFISISLSNSFRQCNSNQKKLRGFMISHINDLEVD